MKKTAGRRSFYAFFCLRAGGWVLRRPGGEQVLRLRARDGCFAAPAASRCCACGRGMESFVLRHEYLSFFVKRKVPKKIT